MCLRFFSCGILRILVQIISVCRTVSIVQVYHTISSITLQKPNQDFLIFICMFGILNNSLTVSVPGPDGQPDGGYSMMMFLMGWMVIATALFLLRPSSLRNRGDQKPARRGVCKLRE